MQTEAIARAAGKAVSPNMRSVVAGLERMGDEAGLDRPHRLAHYFAQLMHESAGFHYDREVWGPTKQQLRYERDLSQPWSKTNPRNKLAFTLGNSEPGDGRRFAGKAGIQITGRDNHRQFTRWCRARFPGCPDFEANPNLVNTDPWEGLVPIWYWMTRGLGELADDPGCLIETITRRINGGVNGLADRRRYFTRTALVMIGLGPADVRAFQAATPGLTADGIAGQMTERALQKRLMAEPARPWAAPQAPALPLSAIPAPAIPEALASALQDRRMDNFERRLAILEAR